MPMLSTQHRSLSAVPPKNSGGEKRSKETEDLSSQLKNFNPKFQISTSTTSLEVNRAPCVIVFAGTAQYEMRKKYYELCASLNHEKVQFFSYNATPPKSGQIETLETIARKRDKTCVGINWTSVGLFMCPSLTVKKNRKNLFRQFPARTRIVVDCRHFQEQTPLPREAAWDWSDLVKNRLKGAINGELACKYTSLVLTPEQLNYWFFARTED